MWPSKSVPLDEVVCRHSLLYLANACIGNVFIKLVIDWHFCSLNSIQWVKYNLPIIIHCLFQTNSFSTCWIIQNVAIFRQHGNKRMTWRPCRPAWSRRCPRCFRPGGMVATFCAMAGQVSSEKKSVRFSFVFNFDSTFIFAGLFQNEVE